MATKTSILAPNFTYKPTGQIQVGSIIADPFRPAKSLSQPAVQPAVETTIQHHYEAIRHGGRSFTFSFRANVFEAGGGEVGASRNKDVTESISIERLETRYLCQEPTDDDPELARRLAQPAVRAAVRGGLYGRAPVYLISGIKIARGLSVRSETGSTIGGSLNTSVPAAQAIGLDIGAGAGSERSRGTASSFDGGDEDVIIAYQLHILRTKGRLKKRIISDVFESDAAFLHDEELTREHDSIEVSAGDFRALREVAEEMEMTVEREIIGVPDGDRLIYVQATEL